ncbi:hypothetical protein VTN02DRAFT_1113 [Thermoascus thermophilus]
MHGDRGGTALAFKVASKAKRKRSDPALAVDPKEMTRTDKSPAKKKSKTTMREIVGASTATGQTSSSADKVKLTKRSQLEERGGTASEDTIYKDGKSLVQAVGAGKVNAVEPYGKSTWMINWQSPAEAAAHVGKKIRMEPASGTAFEVTLKPYYTGGPTTFITRAIGPVPDAALIHKIAVPYRRPLILCHSTSTATMAARLEAPITGSEIRAAIRRGAMGKSPGPDGLPVEFYKT